MDTVTNIGYKRTSKLFIYSIVLSVANRKSVGSSSYDLSGHSSTRYPTVCLSALQSHCGDCFPPI